ncbi:MAG: plastocyanin/azurin family copper-binding protein [Deltaproteobacteria bacterium]
MILVGVIYPILTLPGMSNDKTWTSVRGQTEETDEISTEVIEIHMKSDKLGSKVWFDPIGVYIKPGQTVRWIVDENVHTTTAYHPENNNHSLRIPRGASPWDSGFLFPGSSYEVTFTVEGVYDYFCSPHEVAGMVGRIVVGNPTGPGSKPYDYFKNLYDYFKASREPESWIPVPPAAQEAFPDIELIMKDKVVHYK